MPPNAGNTTRRNRISQMTKTNQQKLNEYLQKSSNVTISHPTPSNTRLKRMEGFRLPKMKMTRFSNKPNTVFGTNKRNTNKNKNLSKNLKESRKSINITQKRVFRPSLTQEEAAMLANLSNGKNSLEAIREAILKLKISNVQKRKLYQAAAADFHNV